LQETNGVGILWTCFCPCLCRVIESHALTTKNSHGMVTQATLRNARRPRMAPGGKWRYKEARRDIAAYMSPLPVCCTHSLHEEPKHRVLKNGEQRSAQGQGGGMIWWATSVAGTGGHSF